MDNDDQQVGRILTRREVLALLGLAGGALLAGCGPDGAGTAQPTQAAAQGVTSAPAQPTAAATPNAEAATSVALATAVPTEAAGATAQTVENTAVAQLPACVVSPALTEGPYFVDEQLDRSDIRSDPATGEVKAGTPLQLALTVAQVSGAGCTPLAGATVDIWHCDAQGIYSDVSDRTFDTTGQKFLRGSQVTDANGRVQFTTIYPGWYSGRAVHMHFKVRTEASGSQGYEFTSQFFFDDALSAQVYTQTPYADKGSPDTPNSSDGIYRNGGEQLLLAATPAGDGYAATFDIGLELG